MDSIAVTANENVLSTYTRDDRVGTSPSTSINPSELAVGVIVGRASEYFDFFVYAIASALVFPSVFFPFTDRLHGTLLSFVVFSFAFIARPFGTVAFMWVQERYGRQAKLAGALFLLGTCTAGMAFLPGFKEFSKASIIFLALLRIGQGIALGGAWDGLPSLLAITAPSKKRAWYAMLGQTGAPFGFMVAAGLFAYLTDALSSKDFIEWGWRYPFYVAFAINVVALFTRLRIVSTKMYSAMLDTCELRPSSVVVIAKDQGSNVAVGALAALASYALFHLMTVFPLSWILLYSTRSISDFLIIQMGGAVLALIGVVLSGVIGMRLGRKNTLAIMAVAIAVFSFFVPSLVTGSTNNQNVFVMVGYLILGLSYGQAAGAVTSNFLPHYRYTGAALTSDLAWLVGAGFAPLVALGLSARFGAGWLTVYLISGAIGSLIALSANRIFREG
jgi:MFS family permease